MRRRFTVEQIEKALRAHGGIQAAAARALEQATGQPVNRNIICQAIQRTPKLQQVVKEAEDFTLDLAESVVLQAINSRDFNAAKFFLETRGKHRGYTRRSEVTGAGGGPVEMILPAQIAENRRRNEQLLDDVASRTIGGDAADATPRGNGEMVK